MITPLCTNSIIFLQWWKYRQLSHRYRGSKLWVKRNVNDWLVFIRGSWMRICSEKKRFNTWETKEIAELNQFSIETKCHWFDTSYLQYVMHKAGVENSFPFTKRFICTNIRAWHSLQKSLAPHNHDEDDVDHLVLQHSPSCIRCHIHHIVQMVDGETPGKVVLELVSKLYRFLCDRDDQTYHNPSHGMWICWATSATTLKLFTCWSDDNWIIKSSYILGSPLALVNPDCLVIDLESKPDVLLEWHTKSIRRKWFHVEDINTLHLS